MKSFSRNLYSDMLLSIKRGKSASGTSNAKPYFLLSIINCIFMGLLKENKITYDNPYLNFSYYAYARYYNDEEIPRFIVPYYHLATSGFYSLIWRSNITPRFGGHTPSSRFLHENLLYAKLDDELWELLQEAENREFFKKHIIDRFLTKQQTYGNKI